jgi:crotonobetainyl-CoA:carnitine CoA-transferase CaiB-like acyl-CoA transferase
MTSIQPLRGLRVIDLTLLPPGGYCTVQLADLGADVVRIEAPAAAGKPSLVVGQVGLSRGKRSMTLDQRHPAATEVLKRLARAADILVENNKPGAMAQRGYGYPQAATDAPRLIWCSITGFGQDGPWSDRAGHDLSYLGQSGLMAALSPTLPWHPAAMISVPVGAMMATQGILAAVIERGITGKGCQLDISLAEACAWLLAGNSSAFKDGYVGITATPDRRLYACADGKFVTVAAAEPRTWGALCEGLGAADIADKLGVRGADAEAVRQRLADIFITKPAAAWVELLGPLGAAVNPVNQGADILTDPQFAARGTVIEVSGEPVPRNPIRISDDTGRSSTTADAAPPTVGQHTDDVLRESGFSQDEIAKLRADGAIA